MTVKKRVFWRKKCSGAHWPVKTIPTPLSEIWHLLRNSTSWKERPDERKMARKRGHKRAEWRGKPNSSCHSSASSEWYKRYSNSITLRLRVNATTIRVLQDHSRKRLAPKAIGSWFEKNQSLKRWKNHFVQSKQTWVKLFHTDSPWKFLSQIKKFSKKQKTLRVSAVEKTSPYVPPKKKKLGKICVFKENWLIRQEQKYDI